jgi:hypothetical protein
MEEGIDTALERGSGGFKITIYLLERWRFLGRTIR